MRTPMLAAALLLVAPIVSCRNQPAQIEESSRSAGPDEARDARQPTSLVGSAPAPKSALAGDVETEAQSGLPVVRGDPASDPLSRLIIRTGQAGIEVDSLEPALAGLRAIAQRAGGFLADASLQTGGEQVRQATVEIKVPAARFDDLTDGLRPLGRVEFLNVGAEDVSEEFVDLTARSTNARRLEERLLELLASRTGKLQDVLTVERELARVREEIERMEGRLRFLRTRAQLSTLTVSLHEPRPLVANLPGSNPLGDAVRQAWRNFVGLLAGAIASLGYLAPLAAFGWGMVVLVRRVARRPA